MDFHLHAMHTARIASIVPQIEQGILVKIVELDSGFPLQILAQVIDSLLSSEEKKKKDLIFRTK